jgi:hypothetical protein
MWIVFATGMGVLVTISAEARVHAFRFPACPEQMRLWLRTGRRL